MTKIGLLVTRSHFVDLEDNRCKAISDWIAPLLVNAHVEPDAVSLGGCPVALWQCSQESSDTRARKEVAREPESVDVNVGNGLLGDRADSTVFGRTYLNR